MKEGDLGQQVAAARSQETKDCKLHANTIDLNIVALARESCMDVAKDNRIDDMVVDNNRDQNAAKI